MQDAKFVVYFLFDSQVRPGSKFRSIGLVNLMVPHIEMIHAICLV